MCFFRLDSFENAFCNIDQRMVRNRSPVDCVVGFYNVRAELARHDPESAVDFASSHLKLSFLGIFSRQSIAKQNAMFCAPRSYPTAAGLPGENVN